MTKATTKKDNIKESLNQLEFLPNTILASLQVLDETWEKGYQYAQQEIKEELRANKQIVSW